MKTSILETLAKAIEPERTEAKSVARRIKPLKEIKSAKDVFKPGEKPMPTNGHVKHLDGSAKIYYTDGSLRHPAGKKGRTNKKQRRHVLRFGANSVRAVRD